MKNHNKILLKTISVGILSVSILSGSNSLSQQNGSESSTIDSPLVKLNKVKVQLKELKKDVGVENTNFLESKEVEREWEKFQKEYEDYVNNNNSEANPQEITQFFQDSIKNKINELNSIFPSQDEQNNGEDQQDNLEPEEVEESLTLAKDSLNDIETYLEKIEELQLLQQVFSSSTSNEQNHLSNLITVTFILVLVTFVLILMGVVFLARKDIQERKKKQSENSQNNANINNTEISSQIWSEILEMYRKFEKTMLAKFVELSQIITAHTQSEHSMARPHDNQIIKINEQIFFDIQKDVESLPKRLEVNFGKFLTTSFNQIIPDIQGLEQKIEDNAKVSDIEQLRKKLVEELKPLPNQSKSEIQNLVTNESNENREHFQAIRKKDEIIANLEQKNRVLEKEKEDLQQNLDTEIQRLKEKLKQASDAEIKRLTQELNQAQSQLYNNQFQETREKEEIILKLENEKRELEGEKEDLQQEKRELEKEKEDLQQEKQQLQQNFDTKVQRLKEKLKQESDTKILELKDKLYKAQSELSDKNYELQQKENQMSKLQIDNEKLQNTRRELNNQTNSSQDMSPSTASSISPPNKTSLPPKIVNLVNQYNQNQDKTESLKYNATIEAEVSESAETYQKRREDSSQPLILTRSGKEYLVVSVSTGRAMDSVFWVFPKFTRITPSFYNSTGKNLFDFNKHPSPSGNHFTLKRPAKVITYESGWKLQEKGQIEITS